MKLLTHNFLQSIVKGVTKPYPLKIEASQVETYDNDYNSIVFFKISYLSYSIFSLLNKFFHPIFVKRMLERIDYNALISALSDIKFEHNLPANLPELDDNITEETLKIFHHILFEVEVMEGFLVCPESGRQFPISKGIPNMLLTEAEVS